MHLARLLKKWSALEPEKCSCVAGMFAVRGWMLCHETDIAEHLTDAELQCAVQDAIEAHGWNWFVGKVVIEDGAYYKARIAFSAEAMKALTGKKLNTFLSTHSPSYALLQSYLEALSVNEETMRVSAQNTSTVEDASIEISAVVEGYP